jgi:hypothetical protein
LALLLWTTAWLLLTLALASTAALARALAPPVRSLLNNLVQSAAQNMRNEERAFFEARSFCVHFFAHSSIFISRALVKLLDFFLPFHAIFTNSRKNERISCIWKKVGVKSSQIAFAIFLIKRRLFKWKLL